MQTINQVCWEILSPTDPLIEQVRNLYQSTQKVEEQIPWEWIEGSLSQKAYWKPGRWLPHLLVTADVTENFVGPVHGFIAGGHVPDYGGYVSYVGVDPSARKRGLGTLLYESMFAAFREDARNSKAPLPFVVWESCQPALDDPISEWNLWSARMKLFERVGAYWVGGLDFLSPNFMEEEEDPITLQLFVKPVESAPSEFDSARLRRIALELQQKVYRLSEDDPLVTGSLPPGCSPRLISPLMATREVIVRG
jgi:GNAT superfamily N-acetyltransferase